MMLAGPAAAAPPAPIRVLCARPGSADAPLGLDAAEPLVVATPCLGWHSSSGMGANDLALSTPQMLKAFGARCYASRVPADIGASRRARLLQLGLTAAAWGRILAQLVASGLLHGGVVFHDVRKLAEARAQAQLARPSATLQ